MELTNTKTLNLESLIEAKKFNCVDSDITSRNFPPQEIRGDDYRLFHFNKRISSEDAIKEMESAGYMPCNIYELLAWSEWNEKDLVVALGSSCMLRGSRHVPGLGGFDSGRYLGLGWWRGGWGGDGRFLAVRNSSLSSSKPKISDLRNSDSSKLPDELIINGVTYVKK